VVKRRVELTMNRAKQHEGKRETKTKRNEKTEKEKKKHQVPFFKLPNYFSTPVIHQTPPFFVTKLLKSQPRS